MSISPWCCRWARVNKFNPFFLKHWLVDVLVIDGGDENANVSFDVDGVISLAALFNVFVVLKEFLETFCM